VQSIIQGLAEIRRAGKTAKGAMQSPKGLI